MVRVLHCVNILAVNYVDINECDNTTTNNCTMNVQLCVNVMGSYECCNASLRDCQRRAGKLKLLD